jgi:protein O-GlcNAc transferase
MTEGTDPLSAIEHTAIAAFSAGRLEEARRGGRWLLAAAPIHPTALMLLGAVQARLGDAPRGLGLLARALAVGPQSPQAQNLLGNLLFETGATATAAARYRTAAALAPDLAEAHYNLGGVETRAGDTARAERCYRRATALLPTMADAWANLAGTRLARPDAASARRAARHALAMDPVHAVAWIALGNVGLRLAQPGAAVLANRRVLAASPQDGRAWGNLLMAIQYDPGLSPDRIFATIRRWAATVASSPLRPRPRARAGSGRRLRIGYLSAELCSHVVADSLEPLLSHHDQAEFEILLYAEVETPDEVSRRLARFGEWRRIFGRSDAEAAALIRADNVDILVSVAGLTPGNRGTIPTHRPAPVQLSLYDVSSSGLAEMDGWVTDPALHPSDTQEQFTETLLTIPCWYLRLPFDPLPAPMPSPRKAGGPIVFGSFNNAAKLSDRVFDTWARVLAAVPDSLLRLGYRDHFADPALVERVADRLAGRGVARTRLLAVAADLSRKAHLERVGEIDIALDPFPFNGATTSFEALWMGVPVVTLAGQRFIDRVGVSLLTAIGETDLIAASLDDYVARAVALANDPARLIRLRAELRGRVLASPLCDAPAYARAMEALYRDAWRRWGEPGA